MKFLFLIAITGLTIYMVIKLRKTIIPILKVSILEYILLFLLLLILTWDQIYNNSLDLGNRWTYNLQNAVYPLTGNNVEILPFRATGYLIDSTCNAIAENSYSYFEVNYGTLKVKNGDTLSASVYCFVSKDFNGDSVIISVKGAVYENSISEYKLFDTKNDKLNLTNNLFSNGDFKLGTSNWIANADSTTHTLINTPFGNGIKVSRTNGDGSWWSLQYAGRPIIYYAEHRYQIKFLFKIEKGEGIPFSIGWWVNEDNGFSTSRLPLELTNLENGWKQAICSYKFLETHHDLPTFLNSLQNNSVIDIADVSLQDLDLNDTIPLFVDQLNKKGTWQKMTIKVPCKRGDIIISYRISKKQEVDFKFLKGYVVLAKPEYEILN